MGNPWYGSSSGGSTNPWTGGHSGGGGLIAAPGGSGSGGGGGGGNSSWWPDIISHAAGGALHGVEGLTVGSAKLVGGFTHDLGSDYLSRPWTVVRHHPGDIPMILKSEFTGHGDPDLPYLRDNPPQNRAARDIAETGAGYLAYEAYKYNPQHGGISGVANRAFVEDPLGTFLDLSVVGRFAGAGALRQAKLGRLGEAAKATANYRPAVRYAPEGAVTDAKLRQLTDAPHGPLTESTAAMAAEGGLVRTYNPARTLQGMYRQKWFDAFSQQHESLARFGSEARISRVLSRERRAYVSQSMVEVRRENLLRSKLTPEQISAVDVVAEGARDSPHPLQDITNFFESRLKDTKISEESRRGLEMQLDRLNKIDPDILENPTPAFTRYIEHLRRMDDIVSKAAIAGGRLSALSREARRFLPQRVMSGARVESNKDALNAMRKEARKAVTKGVNRRHDLETQLGRHKENITNTSAFIKRMEEELKTGATSSTIAKRELRFARRRLKTAEINRDRVERWLADQKATNKELKKTKSSLRKQTPQKDWVGGSPLEDLQTREEHALQSLAEGGTDHGPLAQFGPTFRQAHSQITPKGAAGMFRDRVIEMITRNPRTANVFKFNEGKIFQAGLLAMNPERFSVDFMVQMQYSHALDVFRHQVLPLARDIDPSQPFNSQFDAIVWTDPEKRGASLKGGLEGGSGKSVPRAVSQLDQATQDAGTNLAAAERDHTEWASQFLSEGIPAKYIEQFGGESAALKKMADDGAMIVPASARKVFEHEISKTGQGVRLFWDRGLMGAWRYLTLNLVPRWLVNNAVTSLTLYALNYAGQDGLRSFLDAAKREKPDIAYKMEKMSRAGRVKARIGNTYFGQTASGTLERPAGRWVEDNIGGLTHQSSFSANERNVPNPGIFAKNQEIAYGKLQERVRKGGRKVAMSGDTMVRAGKKWGEWITNLNSEIENLSRDASTIMEVRRLAKKMGMANDTLEELAAVVKAGKRVDEHLPLKLAQQTIDVMGDFGGLGKNERWIRRYVAPFYSWYKTITVIMAKLILREPLRVAVLNGLSDAALKNPYWNFGFPVPPYLASYIPFGDPTGRSGSVGALSPVGANPFQTPFDLIQQTAGLAGLTDGSATSSPASYLNPFGQAAITALTGQDTFYGGQYSGPGSSHPGVIAGLGSLIDIPQQRLLSQVHPFGFAPGGKYQSRTFDTESNTSVPGLNQGQLDGILQYLGIPVRHVDPVGARQRAGLSGVSGGGSGGYTPHHAASNSNPWTGG